MQDIRPHIIVEVSEMPYGVNPLFHLPGFHIEGRENVVIFLVAMGKALLDQTGDTDPPEGMARSFVSSMKLRLGDDIENEVVERLAKELTPTTP